MGLAEHDPLGDHLRRPRDDEQAVAVALQLGPLVRLAGILDRQRVQSELLLHLRELVVARLEQADPDDMAFAPRPFARFADRDLADAAAMGIDARSDDSALRSRWSGI